jgi:LPS-assembly protein
MNFSRRIANRLAQLLLSLVLIQSFGLTAIAEGENALDQGAVLLQADEASFDPTLGHYITRGNVEATYGGRTLLADELIYDPEANTIVASGHVSIQDDNGGVMFADRVELDGELKDGIIETMGVLLDQNTRLAAAHVERQGDISYLERAVYSPCEVCKETGDTVPFWQIKALRVTHNKTSQSISYRHAYLEVRGIPIFYTPYFSHADPTVPRKSGFLVPSIGNSSDLGNFAEIPYHWVLAPNYDVTLAPLLLSEEAPVMKAEFRMRTQRGEFSFDGSITQPSKRDEFGDTVDGTENRNHLFGLGRFDFVGDWVWGFDVGLTSDDTYLKRYSISEEDELTNRLFASKAEERNFTSIEGLYFVGLRQKDIQGGTPVVLPNANFEYYLDRPVFGGTVSIVGNGLSLFRSEGTDMQRLSIEPNWTRSISTKGGHLIRMFGHVRADVYHMTDLLDSTTAVSDENEDFAARVIPTLGIDWHYPIARMSGKSIQIIEPIAQLAISPYGGNPEEIPNEDSLSFEFDDTNLFSDNKFPGLDRLEDGVRINVGLRASLVGVGSGENSIMIGQSFRLKESDLFDPTTGLGELSSDYVGRLVISPISLFSLTHRFRLDKDDLSFRRNEVDLSLGTPDYSLNVGYLRLGAELSESGLEEREELNAESHLKLTRNWAFEASGRRNIVDDEMVRAQASFVYRDECTEFEIAIRRRFTRFRDIEPATSIFFRVRLTTLG